MGGEDMHDYLAGIDSLVAAGIVDPARVAVSGTSYGGFMSAWLVTQTDRFAAAIPSIAAGFPARARVARVRKAQRVRLPALPGLRWL